MLGAHQLMETTYQLLSKNDPETLRILNDVVILAVHANPDGMELVSNWYMREPDEKKRASGDIPRLYQKYIGYDNNRDFYMNNCQPETRNMSRILFQEWHPQIMYNHHQTGPIGAVLFAPPFRDPFNYNFDPDPGGARPGGRGDARSLRGRRQAGRDDAPRRQLLDVVERRAAHDGLLPQPDRLADRDDRQPDADRHRVRAAAQPAERRHAVPDHAAEVALPAVDRLLGHRELRGLRRGLAPPRAVPLQHLQDGPELDRARQQGHLDGHPSGSTRRAAAEKDARPLAGSPEFNPAAAPGGLFAAARGGRSPVVPAKYFETLRDPKKRDARGYILSSSQADFPTATKFIHALQRSGIDVHCATREFSVAGKSYPAGSYVVKAAQAFRPHVLDLFEPQDHPNDFASPGGPPILPYDNAGWTLAYQMGVEFERVLDASRPSRSWSSWRSRRPRPSRARAAPPAS